jgi:hypothetical protein
LQQENFDNPSLFLLPSFLLPENIVVVAKRMQPQVIVFIIYYFAGHPLFFLLFCLRVLLKAF